MNETTNHEILGKAQSAASWIYRKRDGVGYWTPLVLTAENPDSSSLRLSRDYSYKIFQLFLDRKFFHKIGEFTSGTGIGSQTVPAYSLDETQIKSFKEFSDLPWILKKTPEFVFRFWRKFPGFFMACGLLIVTSFFQSFFGKFGEVLFDWIKSLWK